MKTRREQRIKIVEILYSIDIQEDFTYEVIHHTFVDETVQGIISFLHQLDTLIQKHLVKYTIKRLSYVDRAILRMACFELIHTDTPHEIIINEALEITKLYTDEGNGKMVAFMNGVLDTISNTLKKG